MAVYGVSENSCLQKISYNGLLKGDGNSITAAEKGTDYVTPLQLDGKQPRILVSGLLKGDGNSGITAAAAGTDYLAEETFPVVEYGTLADAVEVDTARDPGVYFGSIRTRINGRENGILLVTKHEDTPNDKYIQVKITESGVFMRDSLSGDWIQLGSSASQVMEQGTSGIWTYRRWNSGTAECWGSQTFSNININTAFGGTFYSGNFGNISFPSGLFAQTPKVFADVLEGTYGCWLMRGSDHPSATQTGSQNAVRGTAVNIPSVTLAYYAAGRWK